MLNHNYIGTEHILLGLIREGEGVAAQVLYRNGADLDQVRTRVIRLLPSGARPGVTTLESRMSVIEHWVGTGPANPGLASLAEQVRRLDVEVERLRDMLRQHGIEPEEETA